VVEINETGLEIVGRKKEGKKKRKKKRKRRCCVGC
jgi:hypothetical protein